MTPRRARAQYHSTAPAFAPPDTSIAGGGNRVGAGAGATGEGEVLLHLLARPPQDLRSYLAHRRRGPGAGALAVSPWFVAEVRAALGGAWPSTGAVALGWARRHCARAAAYGFGGGQPGGAWHYWERPEHPDSSRLKDHGAGGGLEQIGRVRRCVRGGEGVRRQEVFQAAGGACRRQEVLVGPCTLQGLH